tara:strand:+ start:863 stop:1111 length:249 start_codon:yes stop_codon:yes gene_type:complete
MPQNDPATDSINYASAANVGMTEFDQMNFEDIEESDLFWFSDNPNSDQNHAFRKVNENTAVNTRTGYVAESIDKFRIIYQKT